ncbi:MAG TPA: hypothetical protein VF571_09230 [Pyrinomonadaceae bacterium]|jgi:hypothetical protein
MTQDEQQFTLESLIPLILQMQQPKQHLTATPDFVPRNFFEQIQFVENGGIKRVYFYVNGTWKYSSLT